MLRVATARAVLVSTREGSRDNLELIAKHPEIKTRLMPWTKAVFLMVRTVLLCSSDNRGGIKRRDKEIRKQSSGDPSTAENLRIVVAPGFHHCWDLR